MVKVDRKGRGSGEEMGQRRKRRMEEGGEEQKEEKEAGDWNKARWTESYLADQSPI